MTDQNALISGDGFGGREMDRQVALESALNQLRARGVPGEVLGNIAAALLHGVNTVSGQYIQSQMPDMHARVENTFPVGAKIGRYGPGAALSTIAPPIGAGFMGSAAVGDPDLQRTMRDGGGNRLLDILRGLGVGPINPTEQRPNALYGGEGQ